MEWAGMEASVATDCMHLMAEEVFPNVKGTSWNKQIELNKIIF